MKKALKAVGITLAVLVVVLGGFYGWAVAERDSLLERTLTSHEVEIVVPFPLSDAEIEAIRRERAEELGREAAAAVEGANTAEGETAETEGETPETEGEGETPEGEEGETTEVAPVPDPVDPLEGVDLDAIALRRAIARGEHLVNSRYVCVECHGRDFSGGVMIDDPAIGVLHGPNLTSGEGGRIANYTMTDWDRTIRHGILPTGRPSAMPSEDFQLMSDQELSDIIAYIRSFPPVDNVVAPPSLGPVGTVLMATGKLRLSCDVIRAHDADHPTLPPPTEPTPEFGRHLAGVCTGCHRHDLNGGPIAAGPPDWLPAANLTPHADGLGEWQYEDFATAMREMRRPDGSEIRVPMSLMAPYTAEMTDVELQALWAYLQTLEATPTGTD